MLQVAAGRRVAAALAVAAFTLGHGESVAQEAGGLEQLPAPLDPSAPLEPLPDLGVEWPDLEKDADATIEESPDTSISDTVTERRYSLTIEGLQELENSEALREQFDSLSTLEANRDDPANAAQLDRRAREDADLLVELLRSYGYYDALVDTEVAAPADRDTVQVTLRAEPGPLYRFSEVRLPGLEEAGEDAAELRELFGVDANDPVSSPALIAGEAALRVELGQRGYAFAEVGPREITVDHATRTATLVLPVQPKGVREFGEIIVEGPRPLFSARHIRRIARFEPGDEYRSVLVEDLRRALVATGLVSSATVTPIDRPGSRRVDLAVSLTPAPMRTIAGEAGYGTGEGVRLEVSWQHRNFFPPEGAVTFRGVLGTREQLIGASLRRGNFLERDQVLTAQMYARHVDQPAFKANTFQVGAGIERQTNIVWQKKWTWSVGTELIASNETDVDIDSSATRQRTFLIAALPATLSYDGSNDLLDPTRGFRLSGRLSPELSLQSGAFGYARAQIDATFYQPISDKLVIAARTRLGTIIGASRDRIAPSRRFYAGGGGSVRGFGYQDLGPRDPVFDDPIGGRSLGEFALEARVRFGDFGIVPFIDAGNIYTSPLPHLDDLRFGAGIGVRYHTSFGPVRVDVGTPLGRRDGEPRVAVYVGLGQAF
jgi:translocation and assembly module TamA